MHDFVDVKGRGKSLPDLAWRLGCQLFCFRFLFSASDRASYPATLHPLQLTILDRPMSILFSIVPLYISLFPRYLNIIYSRQDLTLLLHLVETRDHVANECLAAFIFL